MAEENVVFEILAGTYEEYLVGYECTVDGKELKLHHTVATHSHRASLKTVAVFNGSKHDLLVTGGSDEIIHIYDLRRRKESGMLTNHSGTITCLRFTPDGSHLVTASEDGSISIIKVGSWFVEKTWTKAHKGMGVIHLCIHPSGKLALSIGKDKTLKTWNLVKGRPAYTINLSGKVKFPELVEWSVCGKYYGLVDEDTLNLYTLDKAGIAHSIKTKTRITCIYFLKDEKVCIGEWSGLLSCFSFQNAEQLWEIKEDDIRIKSLTSFDNYLISVDGQGKLYIYDTDRKEKPKRKTTFETGCRITCIAVSKLLSEEERPKKKLKSPVKVENGSDDANMTPKQKPKSNSAVGTPQQKWTVEDATT